MYSISELSREKKEELYRELSSKYENYCSEGLKLNMTRGKPSPEQINLICKKGILDYIKAEDCFSIDGSDVRNYGLLEGIKEAKELFSEILNTKSENIFVLGNSSLNIEYDCLLRALLFPLPEQKKAWGKTGEDGKPGKGVKVLCPAPGYDRHFAMAQSFGCELITVKMNENGPDIDEVKALVRDDPSVKAIFIVPVYQNPTGAVFSEEIIKDLLTMPTAAPDFRIFCDNAYAVHNLYPEDKATVYDFISMAEACGNKDRVFEFASTSKMTFAGGGISAFASSKANLDWFKSQMKYQTIGFDKLNQLRHVRFFEKNGGCSEVMKAHAEILRPKFEMVSAKLSENFPKKDLVTWKDVKGGYFISIDLKPGQAAAVVSLAEKAGVKLTAAGATFPYGKDPEDRNIRIAPSFPSIGDLEKAMDILVLCIKLSYLKTELSSES